MDEQVKPAEAWKRVLSSYREWEREEVDSSIYVMEALAAYLNTSRRQPAASPSPDEQVKPAEWVLVPRDDDGRSFSDSALPEGMIRAGMAVFDQVDADNANYVAGETTDWDTGMIAVAVYRAMLAVSPSPEGTRERGELVDAATDALHVLESFGDLSHDKEADIARGKLRAALTLPPVAGVDREVVERVGRLEAALRLFGNHGGNLITQSDARTVADDLAVILALVSPLEGKTP